MICYSFTEDHTITKTKMLRKNCWSLPPPPRQMLPPKCNFPPLPFESKNNHSPQAADFWEIRFPQQKVGRTLCWIHLISVSFDSIFRFLLCIFHFLFELVNIICVVSKLFKWKTTITQNDLPYYSRSMQFGEILVLWISQYLKIWDILKLI